MNVNWSKQTTMSKGLLLVQNWLTFIAFQSHIKINQRQFGSLVEHTTKGIDLLLGQNLLIFIIFNLIAKSVKLMVGHFALETPKL